MDKKIKYHIFLISFGITLYAVFMNLNVVLFFLKKGISMIFPILLGLVFAFILNVPMSRFEKIISCIFSKTKYKPKESVLGGISLALTLLCIILIITLAITMVIPALVTSVKSISPLMKEKWPEVVSNFKSYNVDISHISELITSSDIEKMFGSAGVLFDSAVNAASSTISIITSSVFAMVIAIYTLLSKKVLFVQVKKLMDANLKKSVVDKILYVSALVRDTYSKFISGQCLEAIILGSLIFIAYSLFRLPYAGLVAFLTGIFAFVPYIGAFAACFIGAFLILLAAPSKVLLSIVVYLVIQFIENQFIYPHVVGTSVGLSPLWTLIAAVLGGKLFGLPGIIFFIPLVATIYTLVRENTNIKLEEKKLNTKG